MCADTVTEKVAGIKGGQYHSKFLFDLGNQKQRRLCFLSLSLYTYTHTHTHTHRKRYIPVRLYIHDKCVLFMFILKPSKHFSL